LIQNLVSYPFINRGSEKLTTEGVAGVKVKTSRSFPFLLFLLFSCTSFSYASQTLEITVETNKSVYLQGEKVTLRGCVITGITSRSSRLVALWVMNTSGSTIIPPITRQTDEKGDFSFTFKLASNVELGDYTAYASSGDKNENATGHTTFKVEALTQQSNGEIPGDHRILTILILVAVLVALGVTASAFVFLMLRRVNRDRETSAVPREDTDDRYKRCVKCGRRILGFRAFCPYCYSYQGRMKTVEER
jgi:hypothetical protein